MKLVRILASDFWIIKSMVDGKEYHYKCAIGLPEGSQFVRMHAESTFDFSLIFTHESFKDIKLGELIPVFDVQFEQLSCAPVKPVKDFSGSDWQQ